MISTKKRDTYLSFGNQIPNTDPSTGTAYVDGYSRIYSTTTNTNPNFGANGVGTHMFVHCPTWRYLKNGGQQFQAARTSTNPYYKGFSDVMRLVPNDGSTWFWRRIAFCTKSRLGSVAVQNNIGAEAGSNVTASQRRLVDLTSQAPTSPTPGDYQTLYDVITDVLFQGVFTIDWQDHMEAPLDKTRVDVKYDRRMRISSGNASGAPRIRKMWLPINKTCTYDDEENGTVMTPSPTSTLDKRGMGNLYIIDLFQCPQPVVGGSTTGSSMLQISSQSTMYWHEK